VITPSLSSSPCLALSPPSSRCYSVHFRFIVGHIPPRQRDVEPCVSLVSLSTLVYSRSPFLVPLLTEVPKVAVCSSVSSALTGFLRSAFQICGQFIITFVVGGVGTASYLVFVIISYFPPIFILDRIRSGSFPPKRKFPCLTPTRRTVRPSFSMLTSIAEINGYYRNLGDKEIDYWDRQGISGPRLISPRLIRGVVLTSVVCTPTAYGTPALSDISPPSFFGNRSGQRTILKTFLRNRCTSISPSPTED